MFRDARSTDLARSLVAVVRDQQLPFLAAAIAYYAFVSVVPLLLVTVAVSSAVAGPVIAASVLDLVGSFLTPQAESVLEAALVSGTGRQGATVLGVTVLLWSGLRVFRGLDIAFSRVYGSEVPISLLHQVRDALLVVGAIAVAVGATALLGAAVPLDTLPLVEVVGPIGLVIVLSMVFLPVYYVFPDAGLRLRDAVPGAVFAGVGWTLLGIGFGLYASVAGSFRLYGVLGAVLLVLTWFYAGGLLLLVGAALNAVLAGRDGTDRQLQQGSHRGDTRPMSDPEHSTEDGVSTVESESVDYEDLADLRRELEEFEAEIEDRTVHREELEADLRGYVRRRIRRGHARGWGPYLVLLYGTVMTIGAFVELDGGWAVLAMLVVWLSTLGLYALMLVVGAALNATDLAGRAIAAVRKLR